MQGGVVAGGGIDTPNLLSVTRRGAKVPKASFFMYLKLSAC